MTRFRVGSRSVIYLLVGGLIASLITTGFLPMFFHKRTPFKSHSTYIRPQNDVGISIGGLIGKNDNILNKEFADIASMGFTWVRFDFKWRDVQPNNSQKYKWTEYNPVVTSAIAHHLKILGTLGYAPAWAAQAGCTTHNCAPSSSTEFAFFAATVASQYKISIHDWEISNEENSALFWSPAPNPGLFADVLRDSYIAIKNVNPSATVVLGGLTPGNGKNTADINAVQYLKQLYQDGAEGSFDAVGYHPYTYPESPKDKSRAWAAIADGSDSLMSVMRANGDGNKKIWITEYGAPTNGPAGSKFVSEAQQAQLARDAYEAIQSKPWAGPFFWYTYKDSDTNTNTKENFFGLKRADGSPKPAYYAWKQLLAK